ncbi:cytochrome b [Photobacterium galatheae]|uniref:cytochrome b n=1 Tax=Photobacterium galatheae TaxID=1654360 RepID=UPI00202CE66E|nr:cytochrome b/b6 domain-containing protein [Photobacterium galatheae]MCM0148882.1 cytochrome b [Photobacterium galatheae]
MRLQNKPIFDHPGIENSEGNHSGIIYDTLSRVLHWVMATIILYATVAGYVMHFVADSSPRLWSFLSVLNLSLATLATPLLVLRWVWRFFRPAVPNAEYAGGFQKKIAHLVHSCLYLAMFMVFSSGYFTVTHPYEWFWLVTIPQPIQAPQVNAFFFAVHRVSCMILTSLVTLHIAAALHHHYWRKNGLLYRMWRKPFQEQR